MRVTKVNGYKMVRSIREGKIVDKDDKEVKIEDLNLLDKIINREFKILIKKGVKGDTKVIGDISKEEAYQRNDKKKDIRNILSCLELREGKLFIKDKSLGKFKKYIKNLKGRTFVCINGKGEKISKADIISYSLRENLKKLEVHHIIADLISIDKTDFMSYSKIIRSYSTPIKAYYYKQKEHKIKKIECISRSINNNKIQIEAITKDNRSDAKKFRDKISALLTNGYDAYINELKKEYRLDELVKKIKVLTNTKAYQEAKDGYGRNNLIKKELIKFQYDECNNIQKARREKTDLRFYDNEVTAYFHRHFPVKRKSSYYPSDEKYLDVSKIEEEVKKKIKNKAINNLIREGSFIEYKNNNKSLVDIDNKDIEIMHIQDVFSRKLSTMITYAANSFRNEVFGEWTKEQVKIYKEKSLEIEGYNLLIESENENFKILMINILKKTTQENLDETKTRLNIVFKHLYEYGLFLNKINDLKERINKAKFENIRSHIYEFKQLINLYKELSKVYFTELAKDIKDKENSDFLAIDDKEISFVFNELGLLEKFIDSDNDNVSKSKVYKLCWQALSTFRNATFHYNNEVSTRFLRDNINALKYIKNEMDVRRKNIPKLEIEKAYDNAVFEYFKTEELFDFYYANSLFYPKENKKMPRFNKVLRAYSSLLKFEMYNQNRTKLIKNIDQAKELNQLTKIYNSKDQSTKYLLTKVYHRESSRLKEKALLKLKNYCDCKLDKTEYYTNIKNLTVEKNIAYDDFKKAVQKDQAVIIEEKDKKEGFIFDIENELIAIAFLEILQERKYECLFNRSQLSKKISKQEVMSKFGKFKNTKKNDEDYQDKLELSRLCISKAIDEDNIKQSLIYAFASILYFLSKGRISELRNNIASYRQACQDFGLDKTIYETIEMEQAEKLLTILLNTYDENAVNEKQYEYILRSFMGFENKNELCKYNDKLKMREQLYVQKDGQTLIVFSQIVEAYKENFIKRYKNYYRKHPIREEEAKEAETIENNIEEMVKKINDIKEIKVNDLTYKKRREYTKLFVSRKKYEYLKNRLLFNDISKMNRLLVDLYSRFNGLIAVLEKNLYHLKYQAEKNFKRNDNKDIFDEITKDQNINPYIGYIHKEDKKSEKKVRNRFAHFHYLRKSKKGNNTSFIEQLNGLRNLLRVDRKLKNAVTKTVINTFDKHGFELAFTFENHKIGSYDLKRKTLTDIYLDMNYYEELQKELTCKDYFLEMIKEIIFEGEDVDNGIEQKN